MTQRQNKVSVCDEQYLSSLFWFSIPPTVVIISLAASNSTSAAQAPGVVRSCRSQENYFDLSDMICVDIDIDENLASSVDALHYRESVVSRTSDLSGSLETVELECCCPNPQTTLPRKRIFGVIGVESGHREIIGPVPDCAHVTDGMGRPSSSCRARIRLLCRRFCFFRLMFEGKWTLWQR